MLFNVLPFICNTTWCDDWIAQNLKTDLPT